MTHDRAETTTYINQKSPKTFFSFLASKLDIFCHWPIYVYGIILSLASILISGYAIYYENQALQIPLVYYLNDPSLYPNDPFAETLPYYAASVWHLVAFANRWIPLEPLIFICFLIGRFLVIFAAGYVAKILAPHSKLAIIGAMALYALKLDGYTLGGNSIVHRYFEQTGLSMGFFILAFAAFFAQKPWLVALWMGLGFNCNSMFGAYTLTYLGAAVLLDVNYRRNWKKWLLAFALFLLVASPGILLTLSAFGRETGDSQLWYIASQVRFPHHLSPLKWNPIEYGKYLTLIVILLTFLYQNRNRFNQLFRLCSIWAIVSVLWLIYAFVAAYVTKMPAMLVMHPARGITIWYAVAAIALTSACAVKLETSKGMSGRAFWLVVFVASILIWYPIIGPYLLAVGVMILALKPVRYYLLDRGNWRRIALVLTVWVCLLGITNVYSQWQKTGHLTAAIVYRPFSAIQIIAKWAKTNTSPDSVFLVDFTAGWQHFRALSQRPVFMNWKDGSAILWDRSFLEPWVERLNAIGLDLTDPSLTLGKMSTKLSTLYENLTDEDVKQLKSKFPLNYWVVPQEHPSNFKTVFQEKKFKVLKLDF